MTMALIKTRDAVYNSDNLSQIHIDNNYIEFFAGSDRIGVFKCGYPEKVLNELYLSIDGNCSVDLVALSESIEKKYEPDRDDYEPVIF